MRRPRAPCGRSWPRNCRNVRASNFGCCRVTNCPCRRFTAPNKATDFRVGAWSNTGSVFSGGTHITARVPCCWKWHSSKLHKSTPGSRTSRRSFFISLLGRRIRLGNNRSGFAEAEVQVMKNPLALSSAQANAVGPMQMMSEQFSIPEVLGIAELAGGPPQVTVSLRQLRLRQSRRTPRPVSLFQSCKTAPLKSVHPTLHRRGILPQPLCRLVTIHALADEQQPVQAMLVARFLRAQNLLLQCHTHDVDIGNLQLSHKASCRIVRAGGDDESIELYCIT